MPSLAVRYHEATKYAPDTIGGHPGLDWARQPLPYKEYDDEGGVELADLLPLDPNPFTGRPPVVTSEATGVTLAALSRWLYFTYGVTAVAPQPDGQLLLRSAPSAGGLYPAELYLAVRDWPGLEAGLYGYDLRRHRLVLLADGPGTADALALAAYGDAALTAAPLIAVVTGVFQRSRWRYQERAYRRILLDSGHLIGNAGVVASALGLRLHASAAFCDRRAEAALRLDSAAEGVFALLGLNRPGVAERPSWTALPSGQSTDPAVAPVLDAMHAASSLSPERPRLLVRGEIASAALEATHGWVSGERLRAPDQAPAPDAVLGSVIRRRSCRRFRRTPIPREALARILTAGYLPVASGLGEAHALDRERLATFVAINEVAGIAPGVYYLAPHQLELRLVRAGDPREAARFVALGQDLAGDAGAVVFHTADLAAAVQAMGERAYRYLHLDAGIIGQRLNLAAVAVGLGASGIGGFFDDQTADLLGIPHEQAIVYITVLGVPA